MAFNMPRLPASILDDDESIDLGGRLSGALKNFDAAHPWFSVVAAELDENIRLMGQVRARDRASELTADIRAKDAERDELLERIERRCIFLAGEPAPAPTEAAEHVLAAMATRGLPKSSMGDSDQTVRVNELLQDFATAPLSSDITPLGLGGVVTALQQAQTDFEALIAERASEKSPPEDEQLPSTREVRQHLQEALAVVRNDLALAARRDKTTYGSVAGVVSGHVEEIVAKARTRRTKEAGSEGGNTENDAAAG